MSGRATQSMWAWQAHWKGAIKCAEASSNSEATAGDVTHPPSTPLPTQRVEKLYDLYNSPLWMGQYPQFSFPLTDNFKQWYVQKHLIEGTRLVMAHGNLTEFVALVDNVFAVNLTSLYI